MELELSIVVPVYNVKPYLQKCIDSLLDQDIEKSRYEIILVDDGSTDGSGQLCDEFAEKGSNITVIHQKNQGLGAARNKGISHAKGTYIQFVDSDDYLESNVLSFLVEKVEKDELDVLRFNYHNVNEQYEVFEPNKVSKPFVDYQDSVCDGLTFLTERLGFGCYAVQFIIRRCLLANCLFKEGILYEDAEWTPRMLLEAKRVTSTTTCVYYYLMRKGSITQNKDKGKWKKAIEDRLNLMDSLQVQMAGVTDSRWFQGFIAQLTIGLISSISKVCFEGRKAYIQRIKAKEVFPLYLYHATSSAKRKIQIANISPLLLCWLLHFKNGSSES
jgi:glycosyltransferase involved in cell wall biosynthesis